MKRLTLSFVFVCLFGGTLSGCALDGFEISRKSTTSAYTPPKITVYTPPTVGYIPMYEPGQENGEPIAPSYRYIDPNVDTGQYQYGGVDSEDKYTALKPAPVRNYGYHDEIGENFGTTGDGRQNDVNKVELINIETGAPVSTSHKLRIQ